MKIISKYKDYYDYLQGMYGVDNKLILDRRGFKPNPIMYPNSIITLIIAGYKLQGYVDKKEVTHFGKENLDKILEKPTIYGMHNNFTHQFPTEGRFKYLETFNCNLVVDKHQHNKKLDCPILLKVPGYPYNGKYWNFNKYPILKEFNTLSGVIPPKEMWIMLNTWLSERITEKENQVKVVDNLIKLKAAGFDTKRSFRPKMK